MSSNEVKSITSLSQALASALDHARHLLPAQNPLDRFIHHNPLHAFEEQRFEDAVVEAAALFGHAPFLAEQAYREAYDRGRIRRVDVDWVVEREVAPGPVAGVVERRDLVRVLLHHALPPLCGEALAWTLTETRALRALRPDLSTEARAALLAETGGDERKAVAHLWATCRAMSCEPVPVPATRAPVRVRDHIWARTGQDPDRLVNPLLIRWCGAYLDHGVAHWEMARREQGFFQAFLAHFDQFGSVGRPWLANLRAMVRQAVQDGITAEGVCLQALTALGHPVSTWGEVVLHTLLALKGWAGMFQRLADRPDTAPERLNLPTSLVDLLAVRLLLDVSASSWALQGQGPLLERALALPAPAVAAPPDPPWRLFQLAQVLGLGGHVVATLDNARVNTLLREVDAVTETHRQRLWHTAYERRFRVEQLDAVTAHVRQVAATDPPTQAQVAFCIDDREESMRRLLEEVAPWVQTYGVAGNFGISMYYQGIEHGHAVALGPAGFEPRHLVTEVTLCGEATRSPWWGLFRHNIDVGSQTLLRGIVVALGGAVSALPMSLRLLAPRMHARLGRHGPASQTAIRYQRNGDEREEHGLWVGFSLDERVNIVRDTLELLALTKDFAELVVCLGHGSKSMNNPHEAAHDCGACGGGRGGPNARLFARMANESEVRERLATGGIHIPETTWFVGGYHNTADDVVELYDLNLVPEASQLGLQALQRAFDEARQLDALERCRRFDNVPVDATPAEALSHVENRVEDLAQPRPEYGHCTNAVALVGRRAWSRGLFLDRRAFLVSYDPSLDTDAAILKRLLSVVVPVGAGINLEYWFSAVDPTGYGCGTKLPHNITGLIGVMDGHQSDLRTGLPWQMVELHEPVRLLCVVEAPPSALLRIAQAVPEVGRLVANGWVQLASLDPASGSLQLFEDGAFRPWVPERTELFAVARSVDWFFGARGFLPPVRVGGGRCR